jgi:hypothetical protein
MNVGPLCRVFFNDSTQWANIHLFKFLILLHTSGQSASVKIDFNKLLQKYQIDFLFKQNCLVGIVVHNKLISKKGGGVVIACLVDVPMSCEVYGDNL